MSITVQTKLPSRSISPGAKPAAGMTIGEVSKRSGVSAKAIRYYESIGLIVAPARTSSNYRTYPQETVPALQLIHRARDLGFSIDEIRQLLGLWLDRSRKSRDVRALAREHLAELDRRLAALQSMRTAIANLVTACHGDDRPDCSILDALTLSEQPAEKKRKRRAP